MSANFISRGFKGRKHDTQHQGRLPPGQYLEDGWPVLSAGPTPHVPLDQWSFTVNGLVRNNPVWSWDEFLKLPDQTYRVDIHCVTKWSKLDTDWRGVSVNTLLEAAGVDPDAHYLLAYSDGGYTTNIQLNEALDGKAFVAYEYDGMPLPPEHGGPARLVVPQLYFWKSAKWVRGLTLLKNDQPGFWESLGYNNHGDPWKEERYWSD